MSIRIIPATISFALAFAVVQAVSPAQAQVKLRYAHVGVDGAPQTRYATELAALVKERTNGRVEIQVFPNSQLGGVGEMVDGIKSGAIAMGHHDFASLGKILPVVAAFNTPFVYTDAAQAMRATDPRTSVVLQDVNKQLIDAGGMRIVGSLYQGARQLTSKEKVLSPDDMKGKKYRGVPIKLWSSMLTGMGAVATPVEVSELATALATGLVIGQENPLANIWTLKLFEVQKYVMMTSHMQSVLSVFVNERVWNGIPEADRKIIEDAMAEVGQRSLQWDKDSVAQYRKDLESKGIVFVEEKDGLNIPAFRKAVLAQIGKDFPEWSATIDKIQAVK
jgi:tripartite ATP-independent transporter DctP family solute receptor